MCQNESYKDKIKHPCYHPSNDGGLFFHTGQVITGVLFSLGGDMKKIQIKVPGIRIDLSNQEVDLIIELLGNCDYINKSNDDLLFSTKELEILASLMATLQGA